LMITCGQFIRFVANVTGTDFVWFILTFHLLYHCWSRFKWCWRRCYDATTRSLFAATRAVSPASVAIWCCLLWASLQYRLSIVEAPLRVLVVRLISLGSNLNMSYYILFANIFQWCMTLKVGSMG
jgi:hypothetical protein